jgi:26S proteasome non-ATPase regulatory subunit 9
MLPSNYEELKKLYDNLLTQKELLEIEADAIFSELSSPGPKGEPAAGVKDSLIDEEGFPRSDIDIYNVKNKRRRLAEINTDHKTLMKQIEEIVPKLTQMKPAADRGLDASPPQQTEPLSANCPSASLSELKPFAKLDEILTGSPAFEAGIKETDELLAFGNVTEADPKAFASIAKLVGDSVNKEIKLKIKRGHELLELSLMPRTWGGRGLLGCHLTPIKK